MPDALPPCHHPGCEKPGMFGINDFPNPPEGVTRQATYWCGDHRPKTKAETVEPKRAPRQATPQGSLL